MGRFERSARGTTDTVVNTQMADMLINAQRFAQDGNVREALPLFRQIIKSGEPEFLQAACVGAGNLYLAGKRYELAEALYTRALESGADPDLYAEALQNLGIARYVRGDRAGACAAMQELAVIEHPVFSPLAQDNLDVLFGIGIEGSEPGF